MRVVNRLAPAVTAVARLRARLSRPMTLGVRGLVRDDAGRFCLVLHSYMPGWHMPGGGVERGETAEAALARELAEEAGVVLTERATLVSIHDNGRDFPGDQVLIYAARGWRPAPPTQRGEIDEIGWFAPDALPAATTPATRARLREHLDRLAPDPRW